MCILLVLVTQNITMQVSENLNELVSFIADALKCSRVWRFVNDNSITTVPPPPTQPTSFKTS